MDTDMATTIIDWKGEEMSTVLDEVAVERKRQIAKGFTAEHDDMHTDGSLAVCASGLLFLLDGKKDVLNWTLPRITHIRKKHTKRQQLVIAVAMAIAEIERMDRLPQSLT